MEKRRLDRCRCYCCCLNAQTRQQVICGGPRQRNIGQRGLWSNHFYPHVVNYQQTPNPTQFFQDLGPDGVNAGQIFQVDAAARRDAVPDVPGASYQDKAAVRAEASLPQDHAFFADAALLLAVAKLRCPPWPPSVKYLNCLVDNTSRHNFQNVEDPGLAVVAVAEVAEEELVEKLVALLLLPIQEYGSWEKTAGME